MIGISQEIMQTTNEGAGEATVRGNRKCMLPRLIYMPPHKERKPTKP